MRTWCDALQAMRKCYETRNFSGLLGLIEEQQDMANRMESALEEQKSYRFYRDKKKETEKEYKAILKEVNKLRKKAGKPAIEKKTSWF